MAKATKVYLERDLYSNVTARILAELETGAAPWIKPWSATPGRNHPHNAATNRPYSGCNVVLLWMRANGMATHRLDISRSSKRWRGIHDGTDNDTGSLLRQASCEGSMATARTKATPCRSKPAQPSCRRLS